jgi:hypothetical protein
MSAALILCGLLWGGLGATDGASQPEPGGERTIEILIAGPEAARNQLDAALRPLFSGASDIRWTTEEKVPTDRALPESRPQDPAETRQIWIDVSNPLRLRVYLPVANTEGATTVRTLNRTGQTDAEADESARQAVAQIVKTAVSTLRGGTDEGAEANGTLSHPPVEVGSPEEVISRAAQTEHDHDGFFLRILAGYGTLTATEGYLWREYSKFGPTINLAVGGALLPNLIFFGELLLTGAFNIDESGMQPGLGRDLLLWGVGPGIAYYFMPWNVYTSVTAGLAKINFVNAFTDYPLPDTDMGYVGAFSVGKEWWSSPDWGVGIAGRFSYARSMTHLEYDGRPRGGTYVDSDMHATTFSLSLSATYN